eukprot:8306789-Pyramimonas_sp.AAC.1
MVSSVPAIWVSSTFSAVNKWLLVSNTSSQDADRTPKPLVALLSLNEKARGATLVPVPGFKHCKQGFVSS